MKACHTCPAVRGLKNCLYCITFIYDVFFSSFYLSLCLFIYVSVPLSFSLSLSLSPSFFNSFSSSLSSPYSYSSLYSHSLSFILLSNLSSPHSLCPSPFQRPRFLTLSRSHPLTPSSPPHSLTPSLPLIQH